jgi:hypothetical protein
MSRDANLWKSHIAADIGKEDPAIFEALTKGHSGQSHILHIFLAQLANKLGLPAATAKLPCADA